MYLHSKYSPNAVAEIVKSGKTFSIRYTYEGFNKVYVISGNWRTKISDNSRLIHKLRRISSRNLLTYKILEEVIKYQRRYLETADPIDLVPLSQVQLPLDNSWTSRLVSRLSIITPSGEEKSLKWFFPTQRELNKRLIKKFFDSEQPAPVKRSGPGRTDREVKDLLKAEFGISVSRRTICYCRKELGILPFGKRQLGDGYLAFAVNFSQHYPLTLEAVTKYAPAKSGVYELSVGSFLSLRGAIATKQSQNAAFYIGSAKDIRKRFKGHLGQNRNGSIKEILKNDKCFFRYIVIQNDWRKEEKRLYELFIGTYKTPPRCNRVKPGGK